MEIGIYTFGDLPAGTRGADAARRRLDDILAAARLADEAGLHVFGVGEHHRSDYAVSAHAVVLGAIAAAVIGMYFSMRVDAVAQLGAHRASAGSNWVSPPAVSAFWPNMAARSHRAACMAANLASAAPAPAWSIWPMAVSFQ